MRKSLFFSIVFSFLGILACKNNNFKATDLSQYGVPTSIMAPEGVVIASEDLAGGLKNVTLQKDRYDVQIIGLDSGAASAKEFVTEKQNELKGSDPSFKILQEDEDGFVYETTSDGTNYNFYCVKSLGGKFYTFQTGFTALPTKDEAQDMYDAVQSAK